MLDHTTFPYVCWTTLPSHTAILLLVRCSSHRNGTHFTHDAHILGAPPKQKRGVTLTEADYNAKCWVPIAKSVVAAEQPDVGGNAQPSTSRKRKQTCDASLPSSAAAPASASKQRVCSDEQHPAWVACPAPGGGAAPALDSVNMMRHHQRLVERSQRRRASKSMKQYTNM